MGRQKTDMFMLYGYHVMLEPHKETKAEIAIFFGTIQDFVVVASEYMYYQYRQWMNLI